MVVKEFTLPHPPEPMPHLTRLERQPELEKYDWIVIDDDASPTPVGAASRTRRGKQSYPA